MKIIQAVLCFILTPEAKHCLMLHRTKPPHLGEWNAPGGKLKDGETPGQAARRELFEETGLDLAELAPRGYIDCLEGDIQWRMFLFFGSHPQVALTGNNEGELAWSPVAEILAGHQVVHNIPLFLPLLLREQQIEGKFIYNGEYLTEYRLRIIGKGLPVGAI